MSSEEKAIPVRPDVPMIYAAIADVMADVAPVGKEGTNKDQGYKFRSIEDVVIATRIALVKHRVFYLPTVLTRIPETRQTGAGKPMNVVHLEIRYDFYTVDGSSVPAVVWGEGADMADKATNKSMSQALKYCLVQALSIAAEGVQDPDRDTIEAGPQQGYRSAGAAFEDAAPEPRNRQQQDGPHPSRPAVQVPPLDPEDEWAPAINGISDREGGERLFKEARALLAAGKIDQARSDRLCAVITAKVTNLAAEAKARAAEEDAQAVNAPIAGGLADLAGSPEGASDVAWVIDFRASLRAAPEAGLDALQRDIVSAVRRRKITAQAGQLLSDALRERRSELAGQAVTA